MRALIARKIAEHAFAGKKDLAGKPYFEHLQRVCKNLNSFCFVNDKDKEDAEIVAFLHDLLEDCGDKWNIEHIEAIFGSTHIKDALQRLTKNPNEDYFDYIKRVNLNSLSRIVKICDLTDNMDLRRLEKITPKDLERVEKYHKAYMILTS